MQNVWKIKYYNVPGSRSPIYEFIEDLPEKALTKLINTFDLLVEFGIQIKGPHVKKIIGTPLWELRILGQDSIRVFYIAVEESTFLLLHAFKKKKQKTPLKEINIALKRLNEYKLRA